jgi:hypothetical protein
MIDKVKQADCNGRQLWCVCCLLLLECWDQGFESYSDYGCMPPFFVVLCRPRNGPIPAQAALPIVCKTRFRETRGPKPRITMHTKPATNCHTRLGNALDHTALSCITRGRAKPKYSKKTQTKCHFIPTSFSVQIGCWIYETDRIAFIMFVNEPNSVDYPDMI